MIRYRFPQIAATATATAGRFPATILAAFLATAAAIGMTEPGPHEHLETLLMAALLGFPLLTALSLLAERIGGRGASLAISLPAIGIALLAGFYALTLRESDELSLTRFFHWSLTAHAAAAVLPFAFTGSARGFWQYNRILFTRFLLAAVYSNVLFGGLALALAAIDKLLGVDIDGDTYPRLFFLLSFAVNPWFFLAGLPRDLPALEGQSDYPKGLRIFAQYVLAPLVTVYLAILTIYLGKVLITRTWPSGWIGYLVSGVSIAGTLGLLLLHPIRDRPEERWINRFARWFFVALIPALVMALLAVGKRIGQYGVTERRYALLVLALWLLGLAIYYAVTQSRAIRLIPASLALVGGVTAFGPWGMTSVAQRSQRGRFAEILIRNGSPDGRSLPTPDVVSAADRRELQAIVWYLDRIHGPEAAARAIGLPADSTRDWPAGSARDRVLAKIGITEVPDPPGRGNATMFDLTGADRAAAGGIALLPGERLYGSRRLMTRFALEYQGRLLTFTPRFAAGEIAVASGDSVLATLSIDTALEPYLRDMRGLAADSTLPRDPVVIEADGTDFRIRLLIEQAYWYSAVRDSLANSASGTILIRPR